MGNDRDRNDFARERARRLALDEQQRAAKLAEEATQRLTAGRKTLVEALEPRTTTKVPSPIRTSTTGVIVGKQTQMTAERERALVADPFEMLRSEPALVRKAVRAIDAATVRLRASKPKHDQIARAATTIETAFEALIARTGVSSSTLPRHLLGDLVTAERTRPGELAVGTVPPATTSNELEPTNRQAVSNVVETIAPQLEADKAATTKPVAPTAPVNLVAPSDKSKAQVASTTKGAATKGATTDGSAKTTADRGLADRGLAAANAAATRGARALRTIRDLTVAMPGLDTADVIGPALRSIDLDAPSSSVTNAPSVPAIQVGVTAPAVTSRQAPDPTFRTTPVAKPAPRLDLGAGLRATAATTLAAATTTTRTAQADVATLGASSARTISATLGTDESRAQQLSALADRGPMSKAAATTETDKETSAATSKATTASTTKANTATTNSTTATTKANTAATTNSTTASTSKDIAATTPNSTAATTTKNTVAPTTKDSVAPTTKDTVAPTTKAVALTKAPTGPTKINSIAKTAPTTAASPTGTKKPNVTTVTKPALTSPKDATTATTTPRSSTQDALSTTTQLPANTNKAAESLPASYRQAVAADEQRVAELETRASTLDTLDADKRSDEVAKTTQQTDKAKQQHQGRANKQAQHQNKRQQNGAKGAHGNKQKVDARAQENQKRAIAFANRARQNLISELKAHADTALQMLDMNKEQRIATLTQKLEQQKPIIKQRIDQARTDATARWNTDKAALTIANTQADQKIDKDCDSERTITAANFKTMRTQLETNPEQAALTALALSKRDQTRYENTKKTNVGQIESSANKQIKATEGRLADAQKRAGGKDAEGKATPDAEAAAAAVTALKNEISRLTTQRDSDMKAETEKYDGLIERRKTSGEAAAKEIRTDAKSYLASLADKEKAALAEVERIRGEGHGLTKQRYDADVIRMGNELTGELQRLDMQFEHQVIEAEQAIELAKKDATEMTEADKEKARKDITRERDAGVAKIKRASLQQLGEMGQMVAKAHTAIDGNLKSLGDATVLATKQISTLQASFDQKIDRVKQYLEGKANTAIDNQARAASVTEKGLRELRSRRYDSTMARGDVTRDLMSERVSFLEQQKQEDAYAEQRKTEMDHLKTREDLLGQRNVKPEQKWDEQTKQAKANEITKALTGGFDKENGNAKLMYDYAAVRLAFATMTPEQIKDLLAKYPNIKTLLDKAEGPDAICLRQVTGASSPTEMRAALLNWSTNGALGNDKNTNAAAALISPLAYLWTAGGYDKAAMEAMFKSMSPAEKQELDALYKDKYGLSVADEIKDEAYSVANRDSLLADWSTDPAEKLRLKAQNSQLSGTYGNILGTIKNAGYLFGVEVTNEQAMNIFMAPTDLVAFGLSKITGDDTWTQQQELVKKQGLDIMIDPNVLMNSQRDYMNDMKPQPWDSPIEKLRKQQQFKDVNENLRVDGRSLTELDNVAANNNWQKLWGGNKEMGDAFTALREGNEEKFLRERMGAGLAQNKGSETWIKEGLEDAAKRGKLEGLKKELADRGMTYEQMVDKRFGGNDVDVTYFKVLGEKPADPTTDGDNYARQVAAKLAYYQLGGTTGWGNDLAGIAKEMENLPKELKEQVQAHYADIVKSKTNMSFLPNWAHYAIDPLGNWSTGNVWDDIEMSYGGQWNRWTGGAIGKGTDYEKLRYDIENGKPTTPQEQYERALARYRIDMADTSNMSKIAADQAREEIEKLKAAYEMLPANLRGAKLDSLSEQQKEQLGEVNLRMATAAGWQDTGNVTQVSYVETVGYIVGTVVSTAIIIVGSIFTGGAVAAIVVPVAAAVIGGLAMIGTKIIMLGDKYSGASFQKDFAEIVIDAVMAGVMGAAEFTQVVSKMVKGLGVTGKYAEKLLTELIQNAASLPGGFGKAMLDPELWKGDSADVLNRIKAMAGTQIASAVVSSVVSTVADGAIKVRDVPGRSALTKSLLESGQGALVAALSSGAGALCEIDPSKPMGAQFLNVLKAASIAGIQSGAQKVGEGVRERRRPSNNEVAIENDGTVVVNKSESVAFLKELSRAASADGETISWKQLDTVDADGRRIIVVSMADGTERRIAIDDGEPKLLTTSEKTPPPTEPKLLTTDLVELPKRDLPADAKPWKVNEDGVQIYKHGDDSYVDANGRRTDDDGALIDRDGALIDVYGRKVNLAGKLVNDNYELIDEAGNRINDDGTPYVEPPPAKTARQEMEDAFRATYGETVTVYRALRLAPGTEVSGTYAGYHGGGQLVTLTRDAAMTYGEKPPGDVPGGREKATDIVIVSFQIRAEHVALNIYGSNVEHMFVSPDVDITQLPGYSAERFPANKKTTQEPKQLTTSTEPKLLTEGTPPIDARTQKQDTELRDQTERSPSKPKTVDATDNKPKQLTTSEEPKQLTTSLDLDSATFAKEGFGSFSPERALPKDALAELRTELAKLPNGMKRTQLDLGEEGGEAGAMKVSPELTQKLRDLRDQMEAQIYAATGREVEIKVINFIENHNLGIGEASSMIHRDDAETVYHGLLTLEGASTVFFPQDVTRQIDNKSSDLRAAHPGKDIKATIAGTDADGNMTIDFVPYDPFNADQKIGPPVDSIRLDRTQYVQPETGTASVLSGRGAGTSPPTLHASPLTNDERFILTFNIKPKEPTKTPKEP